MLLLSVPFTSPEPVRKELVRGIRATGSPNWGPKTLASLQRQLACYAKADLVSALCCLRLVRAAATSPVALLLT
jgi:hypothetical protein